MPLYRRPGGLIPVSKSGNYTAANGDMVLATGAITISLPANPLAGVTIGVKAVDARTGAAPVTVTAATGFVYGLGIGVNNVGLGSMVLGIIHAYAVFVADGTGRWDIIEGQQDTGHLAFPFAAGETDLSGHVASYRKMGDWVTLRGFTHFTSGASPWPIGTLPTGFRPLNSTYFVTEGTSGSGNGSTPYGIGIEATGVLTLSQNTVDNWTGSFASLANIMFVAAN